MCVSGIDLESSAQAFHLNSWACTCENISLEFLAAILLPQRESLSGNAANTREGERQFLVTVSKSPSNVYPIQGLLPVTVIYMGQSPYLGIWAIWLEFPPRYRTSHCSIQLGLVHPQFAGSGPSCVPAVDNLHFWSFSYVFCGAEDGTQDLGSTPWASL